MDKIYQMVYKNADLKDEIAIKEIEILKSNEAGYQFYCSEIKDYLTLPYESINKIIKNDIYTCIYLTTFDQNIENISQILKSGGENETKRFII